MYCFYYQAALWLSKHSIYRNPSCQCLSQTGRSSNKDPLPLQCDSVIIPSFLSEYSSEETFIAWPLGRVMGCLLRVQRLTTCWYQCSIVDGVLVRAIWGFNAACYKMRNLCNAPVYYLFLVINVLPKLSYLFPNRQILYNRAKMQIYKDICIWIQCGFDITQSILFKIIHEHSREGAVWVVSGPFY